MTLSEAIKIMKEFVEYCKNNDRYKQDGWLDCYTTDDDIEAIDTVLKALEKFEKQLDLDYVDKNYISKDEIRKKMDNEEKLFFETKDARYANRRKILKELLGEE